MNSNLQKALATSMMMLGLAAPVLAQLNFDDVCTDPNNTAPYSAPFGAPALTTPLWIAGMGFFGTVAWKFCVPGSSNGGTIAPIGRMGLSVGATGTIQDDLLGLTTPRDNNLRLTYGMNDNTFPDDDAVPPNEVPPNLGRDFNSGSGSDWSYANIWTETPAGAYKSTFFGSTAFTLAFVGASNRYLYATMDSNGIDTRCVIDCLGDTARVSWQLTNNTTGPLGLGLWYGAWTIFTDENGLEYEPVVNLPGQKPRLTEGRFTRATDPVNFPAYVDFTVGQSEGWGLQVVNQPITDVEDENGQSDQTPVDEFALGNLVTLLDGTGIVTSPTFNDFVFPDTDLDATSYIQKWGGPNEPTTVVPAGGTETIISYYRSTTGDANYANGYTAVVDTPKALSLSSTDVTSFSSNPFTIRVWIDNTGGFGIVNQTLPLTNVAVTLQLPNGLSAPNNPAQTTITQYINEVGPVAMTYVDFQVQADPTLFGVVPYTVTITPTPGAVKVVTGNINVETTPLLLIRPGANLVAPPWNFGSPTWAAVLSPLQSELDYQAYAWDPLAQQYIISTGPSRGIANWILSNQDLGYEPLGGSPSIPMDMFTTQVNSAQAPIIQLQPGWNLVGNPYPYSIPLGQLVGAINGTTTALTYDEMVSQGVLDGAFANYNQDLQSYQFIQADTDYMLPNYGYWVYSNDPLVLQFPLVYDIFDRAKTPTPTFNQNYQQWRFQLAAKMAGAADLNTYVGFVNNAQSALRYQARKAPINPATNAIRAFVTEVNTATPSIKNAATPSAGYAGTQFAEKLHTAYGKQTFHYNVFSRQAGEMILTWPNLAQIPTNLEVQIEDLTTKKTINARSTGTYSYQAIENSQRTFQVTITPLGAVRQSIGAVSEVIKPANSTRQMILSYNLASRGAVSIYVYKGSTKIGTVVQNANVMNGANTIVWPMVLSNGTTIPSGSYTFEFQATGEGGDTATKLVPVTIH